MVDRPDTAVEYLQSQLLRALDCVELAQSATYVSGPITTGRRFVEWYSKFGHTFSPNSTEYRTALREQVVRANEQDILHYAKQFRTLAKGVVIEPTSLRIENWSQADFHRFWGLVIQRYCSHMVVLDGWQYSVGCAVEFRRAIDHGVCVQSTSGEKFSAAEGRKLVRNAAADLERISAGKPRYALGALARQLRESAGVLERGDERTIF
jgi:hypothetical protein